MEYNQFLHTAAFAQLQQNAAEDPVSGSVDLSRAAAIEIGRDTYLEAESRGMTLSELLEADEYDPSPSGCALDAFERQLALAGVRLGGKAPTTLEQFYQKAPALVPE